MLGGARSPGGKRFRLISFRGSDEGDMLDCDGEDPSLPMGYASGGLGYGSMMDGGAGGIRLSDELNDGEYVSGSDAGSLWGTSAPMQQGYAPRPLLRPQQSVSHQQPLQLQQQAQFSQGLQQLQLQQPQQLDGRYGGQNVRIISLVFVSSHYVNLIIVLAVWEFSLEKYSARIINVLGDFGSF